MAEAINPTTVNVTVCSNNTNPKVDGYTIDVYGPRIGYKFCTIIDWSFKQRSCQVRNLFGGTTYLGVIRALDSKDDVISDPTRMQLTTKPDGELLVVVVSEKGMSRYASPGGEISTFVGKKVA